MEKRFWEIDFLRGVAIVMMMVYHFVWDLNYFTNLNISLGGGFWEVFRIVTASAFLFLVGISLFLSTYNKRDVFFKLLKRGSFIFFLGLLLTLFSKFFFPDNYISFGILHLIGFSVVFSYVFLRFKFLNLFFGLIFLLGALVIKQFQISLPYLSFLGFSSESLRSLDYYPVLPWFGVVLLGLFAAKIFYAERKRQFVLPWEGEIFLKNLLAFFGKNSLLIYFIHQPIFFFLFYVYINF